VPIYLTHARSRKISLLPNAESICENARSMRVPFLDAINNANNLYYVDTRVNALKAQFFRANEASPHTIQSQPQIVQSATMKYLKDLSNMAQTVAADLVKGLNDFAGADINEDVTSDWTVELAQIVETAIKK
jgi:hypothetical protein